MKKYYLLFLMVLSCVLGFSQSAKEMLKEIEGKWELDNNNNVTFTKVIDVPGISRDELYTRALSYFTYNYKSGDAVIQVEDKEKGVIVGKGLYSDVHVGVSLITTEVSVWHIIRIDVKDNKARVIITLSKYKIITSGGNSAPSVFECSVSSRYPVAQKDGQKTVMTKAFYKSYMEVQDSFDAIEKALKEGNTGNDTNEDW